MKHEKLVRAMGEIDEDLILEAHEPPKRAKTLWIRMAACAACVALLIVAAPRLVRYATEAGSVFDAEMDAFQGNVAPSEKGDGEFNGTLEAPEIDASAGKDQITEEDEAVNAPQTGGLPETNEAHEVAVLIQLGLLHQGGAYTFGQTVENEYGSAALVDRVGSTVSLRVTLLQDQSFSIGSATSGIWRLTVNGEKAEKFPDKAGTYEIVIDFSDDKTLDLIYVEHFGVFSVEAP